MAIQNPNSCRQGFDPDHADNPYHDAILRAGFAYSHSTPVNYSRGGADDIVIHHTYKRGQRNVSVEDRNGWKWEASARCGSGRSTRGSSATTLAKYLKNLRKRGVK